MGLQFESIVLHSRGRGYGGVLGSRALTGIGPHYKDSRHYLSGLLPLAMLHLVEALQHSKIVSQTRDHIFKHMSLEETFHTQNMTTDWFSPSWTLSIFYFMCFASGQYHDLLWSMTYKEKGQVLSCLTTISAMLLSPSSVLQWRIVLQAHTHLVLRGASWEVFGSLGYASERL